MAIILLATTLVAQPDTLWTKTYGGPGFDEASLAIETSDQGFIVVGYTTSFGEGELDVYLIKTDANGDSVWARTYGGPADDQGLGIVETPDGCYIAVGKTFSFGAGGVDIYAVKTSADGDSVWARTYGDEGVEQAFDICEASDGGYIICGSSDGDACLLKIDEAGDTVWFKTHGKEFRQDWGLAVAVTADGGYIVTGWADIPGNDLDAYLIKTDMNGDSLWTRTYGGTDFDMSSDVQQVADGGYIIAGTTESFAQGGWDIWALKTDPDGDTMWTKTFGGLGDEMGLSAEVASDGNYIFAGFYPDAWLVKTDPLGDAVWEKHCGGALAYSVRLTSDDGYIVGGMISTAGGDVYLVRLGSEPGIEEIPSTPSPCITLSANSFTNGPSISYQLPVSCNVQIVVYDPLGRKVKMLADGLQTSGTHTLTWDGCDDAGERLSSGVYFMRLDAGVLSRTARLVIIR